VSEKSSHPAHPGGCASTTSPTGSISLASGVFVFQSSICNLQSAIHWDNERSKGQLGFLNPAFLFGVIATVAPLLIHLWSRRQAKMVDFSSLMFLRAAHRQNVRRIQLKRLLILILRMLIIASVALALARPLLKNQFSFAGARAKTSVVIILDNSYSMAYQGIEGQRFERARQMALEVAQSLQRGDSASVILMSDLALPIFRRLTTDLEQVETAVREAPISYRPTSVPPSLEMAHEILDASNDPNKEIYLITDLNRNGWEGWGRIPNRSNARIFLLPVGDEIADNISIEEVKPATQLNGINLPVQMEARIRNDSDAPLRDAVLTIFIDNQKRRSISLNAPPNGSAASNFTHQFESPGVHTGYLELSEDRLTIDNRRYFALNTYGQIRVLCVGTQTPYLTLALNPAVEQRPDAAYTILPSTATIAELENLTLTDYDILALADAPTLSNRVRQKLQAFMRDGKGVVYFVSDAVDRENYNAFADWLPASFGESVTWQPPQTLSAYQKGHPIFDVFKPEDFAGQYAPQFYRGLTLRPAEDAVVVAQLSNGAPFLIERAVAGGRTMLFNVSATRPEGSNLLVSPHFLPLLQQTVLYMKSLQSPREKNLRVGQVYAASYGQSGAATAQVKRLESATEGEQIVPLGEDGSLTFSGTGAPGLYQVEIRGKSQLLRDFFAVNVDPTESDLQAISMKEAANRIHAQTSVTPTSGVDLDATLNAYRVGKEIWSELLATALLLMLVENFLSNRERLTPESPAPGRA
jgi:hypothetical protein